MRRTQDLEEARPVGEKRVSVDWEAAKRYVLSMQQTEGEDAGGFVYNREIPRAKKEGDAPQLKAYGSMTYAGLLAMLHCDLSRDDPRVRSVYQYIGKHWTLDENPGQGNQGLYFYYDILARALDAAAIQTLELADGTKVDWKEALAKELIRRQQADGSWVNDNNRFWEADPALSTSYALIALTLIDVPFGQIPAVIAIYHKALATLILDQTSCRLNIFELTEEMLGKGLNHRVENDHRIGCFKFFEYIRP
jgi:squalene-hopene/tetraprenyl-beta-curcumene cyclase